MVAVISEFPGIFLGESLTAGSDWLRDIEYGTGTKTVSSEDSAFHDWELDAPIAVDVTAAGPTEDWDSHLASPSQLPVGFDFTDEFSTWADAEEIIQAQVA